MSEQLKEEQLVHVTEIGVENYPHVPYFISYDTGELKPIISNKSYYSLSSGLSDYGQNVWGKVTDLTEQEKKDFEEGIMTYSDAKIVIHSIHEHKKGFEGRNNVVHEGNLFNEGEKVVVDEDTLLLPLVETEVEDGKSVGYYYTIDPKTKKLTPIVTFSGRSADLVAGNSQYKKNIFALASSLPDELKEKYIDKIIAKKEAGKYLGEEKKIITQNYKNMG